MLNLELKKERFVRYGNGKGYVICKSEFESGGFNMWVSKTDDTPKYLPRILVNVDDDFNVKFTLDSLQINSLVPEESVKEIEKYLDGYKVAQESVNEFIYAIEQKTI